MSYPPQPRQQPSYPSGGVPPWPQSPNPGFPPQPPVGPLGYASSYGPPQAIPPYPGYPYGPQRRSRNGLWVTLGIAAVMVAVAALALIVIGMVGESDEAQIKQTINRFAEAVDTGNMPKMLSYLCVEEAQQITGDENYDPTSNNTFDPIKRLPVNISDVQITGDSATARLSRPPAQARTLRLKKEAGTWKLCDPGPPDST